MFLPRSFSLRRVLLSFPVILLFVLAGAWWTFDQTLVEQETFTSQILEEDFPALAKLRASIDAFHKIETDLYLFLFAAPAQDEESIFLSGQLLVDGVDKNWQGLKEDLDRLRNSHRKNVRQHIRVLTENTENRVRIFRAALVEVTRMASVNPVLARDKAPKVASAGVSLAFSMEELMDEVYDIIETSLSDRRSSLVGKLRATAWQGGGLVLALVGISLLVIRVAGRNLDEVRETLENLADGKPLPDTPRIGKDPDFRPILDVSRVLADIHKKLLKANMALTVERDGLDRKVRDRTRELEEINHGLQRQIEQRRLAEQELRLYQTVVENTDEAVLITDADNRIIVVNDAFIRTSGYERHEVIGKNPSVTCSGRHDTEFYSGMWQCLERTGRWSGEIWDRRKNGEIYPKWLSINVVRDDGGSILNYVGIFMDITEQKAAQAELETLAFKDPLTGLPNRAMFRDRLLHELNLAERHAWRMALFYIDLDRFKQVNDTMGHDAGDDLLKQVAERTASALRKSDTVSRLGGDEFTVILPSIPSEAKMGELAQSIIDRLQEPFDLKGKDAFIGASIGIASYPQDGTTFDELTKNADLAMYQAKQAGRGTYRFFREDMNAENMRRVELERDMRKALESGGFDVWYQPKVDAALGRVAGAEALVRWNHPTEGMLSPASFIAIAEETGLILPLGERVLRQACEDAVSWSRETGTECSVAVNLSPRQFQAPDLFTMVEETLAVTGLRPELLELEITESMAMADPDAAIDVLTRLTALGIAIGIDDFGTGYSSLGQLKRLPASTLKIDRSFVRDLRSGSADAAIVKSIFLLSRAMNLKVVVEGVETREQLAYLLDVGGDLIQGYLFSPPVPDDSFRSLLGDGGAVQDWVGLVSGLDGKA